MPKQPGNWPDWWSWELDLSSPHLAKRMRDRRFSETDLREMLENATGVHENHEPGRWAIETRWMGWPWEVIVEPLPDEQLLLVVTADRIE